MNEIKTQTFGMPRRRLLIGGGVVVAGAVLTGCTSNEAPAAATGTAPAAAVGENSKPGKKVRIVFSGPVADHGFLAAINSFAKKQAATYSDVEFKVLEAAADAPSQIAAVQTAIAEKPDALIIFPQDGDQLTGVGKAATAAGASLDQVMLGTLSGLPTQVVRKVGMTSSPHGPYT